MRFLLNQGAAPKLRDVCPDWPVMRSDESQSRLLEIETANYSPIVLTIQNIIQHPVFFQITTFNNNAQPFYVILSPEGELLTEPSAYDLNVDKFVQFLDEGKNAFEKR